MLGGEGLAQCLRGHLAAFTVQAEATMRARSQTSATCEKGRPDTQVQALSQSIDLIRNVSCTSTLRSALCAQPIDHCPFFRAYERNWNQKLCIPWSFLQICLFPVRHHIEATASVGRKNIGQTSWNRRFW